MSMDNQYEQMQRFRRHLGEVNDRLRAAAHELARAHDRIDPLWRDALRRSYDAEHTPFMEQLQHYLNHDAQLYERFLADKAAALQRYLHGS